MDEQRKAFSVKIVERKISGKKKKKKEISVKMIREIASRNAKRETCKYLTWKKGMSLVHGSYVMVNRFTFS